MKKFAVLIVMVVVPFFIGCNEITLTMNDSGKTISVSKGSMVKIELVSNRSTGNVWRQIDYDKNIIEQAGEAVYQKNKNGLIGSAGKVIYVFKALKKGKTRLRMEYGSLGDKSKAPLKTFSLNIVVQ